MIAYFDCFSGIAGDMVLGAMLDAGLPFAHLKKELKKLPLRGYNLSRKIERRGMIGGVNLHVGAALCGRPQREGTEPLPYKGIHRLISKSRLNKKVRELSLSIFKTLATAEARVHRTNINKIHFHEVGAVDSIIDIVGAAIGFEYFGFEAIYSSPLPITRGWVKCDHGKMPVPAPATLEILKGVSLMPSPVNEEIVTPTGAAIIKTVARHFGENPLRKIKRIGYGLGDRHFKGLPNGLRLMIGEGEPLIIIEANIDDLNPQLYEYIIEKLMDAGAIDAVVRPVFMKKRRPAACIQVLCDNALRKSLIDIILRETTTLGVRHFPVERYILQRETKPVKTRFGTIRMKLGILDGSIIKATPEYEDCKRLAKKNHVPLMEVYKSLNPSLPPFSKGGMGGFGVHL